MQVTYVHLAEGRRHPLGQRAVRALVASVAQELGDGVDRVRSIHFGWNARTTQEGRVVERGSAFDIRVNFTIRGGRSPVRSFARGWVEPVTKCGGVIDAAAGVVQWSVSDAARYCSFIVLHELAHVVYGRERADGRLTARNSTREEAFCDEWALSHALGARASGGTASVTGVDR